MLIGNEPLDLGLTLIDSAQCFRWKRTDAGFACAMAEGPVWLRRTEHGVEAEGNCDREALRRYLDLDRDYSALAEEYAHIPAASRAIGRYPGLRVMNQPAWEALVCFILSANNNVARIRGLTDALCRSLGQEWDCGDCALYGFPTPEALAGCEEQALRDMKVGYRAPFLIGAARRVAEGFDLDSLHDLPLGEAHRLLTTLPGVGDKVADCVLLFGCGHADAFPVDVWVERLLRHWFGVSCKSRAEMARQARALLGEHAGLAQQFLFHAARVGKI